MLPRRQALEGSPADNAGPATKRGGPDRGWSGCARGARFRPASLGKRTRPRVQRKPRLRPGPARKPLKMGRAVVPRLNAFTIRFRNRVRGETLEVELKIDPGAKTTGLVPASGRFGAQRDGRPFFRSPPARLRRRHRPDGPRLRALAHCRDPVAGQISLTGDIVRNGSEDQTAHSSARDRNLTFSKRRVSADFAIVSMISATR